MERDSESENSSDEDIGMEIDELGGVNVKMELKGLSIEEEDFLGIKQLLVPMLPRSNVNISALTDTIIGQNFVGHIIKQVDERSEEAGEDDPVLSISTIVPLSGHEWEKDLKTFCRKKCAELKGDVAAMDQFLEGGKNGWFINSRFINFPARAEGLISVLEDVDEAGKKKHRSSWQFERVMMVITRLHPKASNEEHVPNEITYRNAEDELFEQGAELAIEWNAENDIRQEEQNGAGWDDDELYTQHRMILILKYQKLCELVQMLPLWLSSVEK